MPVLPAHEAEQFKGLKVMLPGDSPIINCSSRHSKQMRAGSLLSSLQLRSRPEQACQQPLEHLHSATRSSACLVSSGAPDEECGGTRGTLSRVNNAQQGEEFLIESKEHAEMSQCVVQRRNLRVSYEQGRRRIGTAVQARQAQDGLIRPIASCRIGPRLRAPRVI